MVFWWRSVQEQGKIRWYECIVKKKFIICLALMMAFWGGGLITNPHKGDLKGTVFELFWS